MNLSNDTIAMLKNFANINIYYIPLDWSIFNGPWFYSEQSYDFKPWSPYRQGLHKLIKQENIFARLLTMKKFFQTCIMLWQTLAKKIRR